jgi:SagB-type dehydrogenase family enzyme
MKNGIGQAFMEQTKHRNLGPSDQVRGLTPPSLELEAKSGMHVLDLPQPEEVRIEKMELREAIERRRSVRNYTRTPLKIGELSYLLWCTQGVKEVIPGACTIRSVPSAGARHSFETYLLVNSVDSLQHGLYRLIATQHRLCMLDDEDRLTRRAVDACYGQEFVGTSAVTFIWAAVVYRMTWRYGERGYRYIHLDAGHVCQNLYLSALSIGCGACAVAAFDDDKLNSLLGVDGKEQFVVYLCTVGKTKQAVLSPV